MSYNSINTETFKVHIYRGDQVLDLLSAGSFQIQWSDLLNSNDNKSVFQDHSFILPWYKWNVKEFLPILLIASFQDRLVGFLALAGKKAGNNELAKTLVGAGDFYALYQSWIVLDEFNIDFWSQGIKELMREFPGKSINLKSIPRFELLENLHNIPGFKNMLVLDKYHNPVLEFDNETYGKIISKRHLKAKFNRLNRAGKLRFEKIKTLDLLKNAFLDIKVFYDLRHGAAFNKTHFGKDLDAQNLFFEWFEKGVLHATILFLDEEMIGAIICMDDLGEDIHLAGLITYSPRHGAYSPGLVHLFLLVKLLKEESYTKFKLSPGYDAYKERFSNSTEIIYELLITSSFFEKLKRKVRIRFRRFLLKNNIRPMTFQVEISKKQAEVINFFQRIITYNRVFNYSNDEILQSIMLKFNEKANELNVHVAFGNLEKLLLAQNYLFGIPRWGFLEDALKRLDDQQYFMTFVKDDKLICCIWSNCQILSLDEINNLSGEISKIYYSPQFIKYLKE